MKAEYVNPFLAPAQNVWQRMLNQELDLDEYATMSEQVTTEDITAIISESTLPDRLATAVLELGKAQEIPVIFLGHHQQVQDAVDLMRLGAKDFLEKPFPQARLIRSLDSLCNYDRS